MRGFFLKKIFEVFGRMVKYWKLPQNRSLNYLSFDCVSAHVQSLAHCKCLPGVVSFSSREQIQGSQTSIMWGLNHLSPNKSTYSLIPQPSLGVSDSCEHPKHLSPCTQGMEGGQHGQTHGSWVRDTAEPTGLHPMAATLQQGLKASTRGFLVETTISKLRAHPLGLQPPIPCACPRWGLALGGNLHSCEEGRPSSAGRAQSRALCSGLTLCFGGVSVGDRWWCCPGEFVTFSMTCNMSASWQWEERLQLSLQ